MKKKNNNGIFYVVISLLACVAVVSGVVAYTGVAQKVFENVEVYNEAPSSLPVVEGDVELGAASGPDHYFQQNFIDGYTSGGGILEASSTLYSALTLTAAQVCDNSYIHVNGSTTDALSGWYGKMAASIDVTLPATSTLFSSCLNYDGATKVLHFRNNNATAASSTELIAGTGCDARISEATGADDTINGLNEARVTIRRIDDTFEDGGSVDCIVLIEETVVD